MNPSLKHANIADLVSKGAKLSKVIDEVKKCEVLCHNCHMLETFKQLGGSYRETMRPISDFDLKDYIRQVTGK